MRSHVQRTVAGCFAILRQLRSIRRSVPSSVFQTLVVALVLSRLDYGNATLAGLYRPTYLIVSSRSPLSQRCCSVGCWTATIRPHHWHFCQFHWLRAPERIKFKLAVVVYYRAVHDTAPRYLSDLLHRVSDITSRRRLQSSTSSELVIPLSRLVTVGDRSFSVAGPGSGTLCLRTLHLRRFTGVSTKTEGAYLFRQAGHYIVVCLACCARWSLKLLLRGYLKNLWCNL